MIQHHIISYSTRSYDIIKKNDTNHTVSNKIVQYHIIQYWGGGYSIRSPDFILVSLKLFFSSLYDIEKKLWNKNFIIIKPNMDTVSYFNDNFIHVFLDLIISGNEVFSTVTKCLSLQCWCILTH